MGKHVIGDFTTEELAKLLRDHPAVRLVEKLGGQYRVYPVDTTKRPVFFTEARVRYGRGKMNLLQHLRRSGIDLERTEPDDQPEPTDQPTTEPTTEQEPVMATPKDMPARVATPVEELRDDFEKLREALTLTADGMQAELRAALEMLAEAERRQTEQAGLLKKHNQMITNLFVRTGDLQARVDTIAANGTAPTGAEPDRPPILTLSQRVEAIVLEFLAAHPGLKMSPAMLEANLADQLPPGRQKTTTSMVLREMAQAEPPRVRVFYPRGESRPGGAPPLYWLDPPAEPEQAQESAAEPAQS